MKLSTASGRYPASRYSSTSLAPCRLASGFLSGPSTRGRWANAGGSQLKAWKSNKCLGADGSQPWVVRDYDNGNRGTVPVAVALGNSLNIPAVRIEQLRHERAVLDSEAAVRHERDRMSAEHLENMRVILAECFVQLPA